MADPLDKPIEMVTSLDWPMEKPDEIVKRIDEALEAPVLTIQEALVIQVEKGRLTQAEAEEILQAFQKTFDKP